MNNPPTLDDDNPFSVYFSSNPKSSARSSSKDVKNPLDSKSRIEHYIKKFPLKGVLFCDFEDKVGPRIVKAYPNDIISDQEFLSISSKLLWRHQYSDNLSLLKQHKQQHQQKNNNHNSNLLDDKMEIETLSSQNSKNVGEKRPHYQSENGIFDVAVDRKKSKNSAKNSQIPTSSEINDNKIISVTTNSHKKSHLAASTPLTKTRIHQIKCYYQNYFSFYEFYKAFSSKFPFFFSRSDSQRAKFNPNYKYEVK